MDDAPTILMELLERVTHCESLLRIVSSQKTPKDFYDTAEIAQLLGKAEFTVREWCRLGRIRAQKRNSGRGKFMAWVVPHAELLRFQREGLLPSQNQ